MLFLNENKSQAPLEEEEEACFSESSTGEGRVVGTAVPRSGWVVHLRYGPGSVGRVAASCSEST